MIHCLVSNTTSKLSIEHLKVNWNSGIEITGLNYCDGGELSAVSIEKMTTTTSLFTFLKNGFQFKEVVVDRPELFFSYTTSLMRPPSSIGFLWLVEKIIIKDGKLTLNQTKTDPIFIKGFDMTLELPRPLDQVNIHFTSSSEYQNKKGMIDLSTQARFKLDSFWSSLQCEILGKVVTFPAPLMNLIIQKLSPSSHMPQLEGYIHLNTKIIKTPEQFSCDLYAVSDGFKADIHTKNQIIEGTLSLDAAKLGISKTLGIPSWDLGHIDCAIVRLQIPEIDHKLSLKNVSFETTFQTELSPTSSLHSHIEKLTLSTNNLEKSLSFSWKSNLIYHQSGGAFNGDGVFTSLFDHCQIDAKGSYTTPLSQNISFTAKGPCEKANIKVEGDYLPEKGSIQSFLGGKTHIEYQGALSIPKLSFPKGELMLDSPLLKGSFSLFISLSPFDLKLLEKASYEYSLTPISTPLFFPDFSTYLAITDSPLLRGECDQLNLSIDSSGNLSHKIETHFLCEKGTLEEKSTKDSLLLTNTKGNIAINSQLKEMSFRFSSSFPYKGLFSGIELSCYLKKFAYLDPTPWKTAKGRCEVNIKDFPTVFISSIIPKAAGIKTWIGPAFSGNITIVQATTEEISFEITSSDFSCVASFIDRTAKKPMKLNSKLSPEKARDLFQIWGLNNKLLPSDPFDLRLEIEKCTLPSSIVDIDKLSLKGSWAISPISLPYFSSGKTTLISNLKGSFSKKSLEPIMTDSEMKIDQGFASLKASFSLKPSFPYLSSEKLLQLLAEGSDIPSSFLDSAISLYNSSASPYFSLLGNTATIIFELDSEQGAGPFFFRYKAPHGRAEAKGALIKNHIFLKEDAKATIEWNPLLEKALLGSNYQIHSRDPIQIKIPAKGVAVSLGNGFYAESSIPSIKVTLGRLSLLNHDSIQKLSSLFRLRNNRLSFWFAPFEAKWDKGIMKIARTEMLIDDKYQICLWGNVFLLKKNVALHLGLTESALRAALGIHGLPSTFVLDIPIKGPYDKIKVDTKLATAKIAALIAHTQSNQMGNLKPFVDLFHVMMNDQSSIPPPRPPYPWNSSIGMAKHIPERTLKKRKKDKDLFEYAIPLEVFSFETEPVSSSVEKP